MSSCRCVRSSVRLDSPSVTLHATQSICILFDRPASLVSLLICLQPVHLNSADQRPYEESVATNNLPSPLNQSTFPPAGHKSVCILSDHLLVRSSVCSISNYPSTWQLVSIRTNLSDLYMLMSRYISPAVPYVNQPIKLPVCNLSDHISVRSSD